jgi:diguanylate cyclase (GGDEF)-like protein
VHDPDVKTRITRVEELVVGGTDCVVVIYPRESRQFGKRYPLERATLTIGRDPGNVIVLDNDSVSRRHCKIERRKTRWYVVDLDSTNGTWINDQRIEKEHVLQRGDQVKVGDTILKYLTGSDVEAQFVETIYQMTIVDGLTGAYNKKYLREILEREIPRSHRHGRPLSLVLFDVDRFKTINDTYGHVAGDYVLKELATLVKKRIRPDDVFGRFGGEEFCVILPETPLAGAGAIAEDLRRRVEAQRFVFENTTIPVTISLGAAQLHGHMDVDGFLKAADEKLYEAKRSGRNRICI